MDLTGWIEYKEKRLKDKEIISLIKEDPDTISEFGGEFYFCYDSICARDHYGIIQGDCPAGTIISNGLVKGRVNPQYLNYSLDEAIRIAIGIRSDEGIIALSGGVDSALVAALSLRPCIVVGMEGCHDIRQAEQVADALGLSLHVRIINGEEIESVLHKVVRLLGSTNPVDIAISVTLFFIAETAHNLGHKRILTGQGADELFGGYARYLSTPPQDLEELFSKDFASLQRQGHRDQSVAGLFGTYLSMPYLDIRVVRATETIPPKNRVIDGVRKKPLREVASNYLPLPLAYQEKKAMQYGTGIWKEIKRLARREGNTFSVTDYLVTCMSK